MVGLFPLHLEVPSGGVESAVSNLIEGLMNLEDMEIHAVACNKVLRKPVQLKHNGVSYHYLPSLGRLETLSRNMLDRRSVLRELRTINPDVVHALDSLKYGDICLDTGYPMVMSIHEVLWEECKYYSTVVERLRGMVASFLVQRHCVKNASHIIQQTKYPEQYFGHLIKGKLYVIANPISERFFDGSSEEEGSRLLYAGWVTPLKRFLDLVQALSKVRDRFPNVSLRVAGGMPDQKYLRLTKDWITTLHLEENVRFLGSLSPTELLEEYRKCTLLALPSSHENSPMVIGEAMAVGKPVVATKVGGVSYLVDDGQTGFLVDVGDIDALATKILTLLSDDELRFKMGKLAKEKANLNFRSKVVAAHVRQVYREAIETANLGK